ncbi:hypothetical protein V5799_017302 [Amblyomma americanum]|uniref:Protein Dr1 n=1 Tax=Amblyomma americanum TaxID=6943 RepID=A0AAQ4F2M6_AMBAM
MAHAKEPYSFYIWELSLPRATLNKKIKESFPQLRIATEARELIRVCCTEFIHRLSADAKGVCRRQGKKVIFPGHVLGALDSMGFGAYRQDLEAVHQDCKEVAAKRRRKRMRLKNRGIPHEQLVRLQEERFAEALQRLAEQEWALAEEVQQQQHIMRSLGG